MSDKRNREALLLRHQLFTLLDLMESFDGLRLRDICSMFGLMVGLFQLSSKVPETGGLPVDREMLNDFARRCRDMIPFCEEVGLKVFSKRVSLAANELEEGRNHKEVGDLFGELARLLPLELESISLFRLPSDKAHYYNSTDLFGALVAARFASAKWEIEESGNCIATGRNTGAAFHLVRVMERGVKAVWKSLGKTPPKKDSSWGLLLGEMEAEEKKPPAQKIQAWRDNDQFFSSVTNHIRSLKNAYRDPTMHVESVYDDAGAIRVMNASREFMQVVSEKLDETGQLLP